VEELCVKVIDEVRGAEDAHTHYHTDDDTSDFMSTVAVSLTTPLHLTSVEIGFKLEADHPTSKDK